VQWSTPPARGQYYCNVKVKQKAGVPWTAHAALTSTPCMPCMGRGRALCIVLSTSLPSPRCRGSVARVEDQDRLAGVWRRLWCADQADVRCRMNPVHADHTATQRPPSSTGSVSSVVRAAALTRRLESERARLKGSTAASSWAHSMLLTYLFR
jgi:hypothetical protein